MASVSKEKNNYAVRVQVDGKEVRFRGFTNKQVAVRLGDKLECLKAAKKTGGISPDLEIWVSELEKNSPELYDKIAGVGLVKEREKPKTLRELLEVHRQRADVIEASREVWDKAAKNLCDFFGEKKHITDITPDDAIKFEKWLRTAPLNYRRNESVPYSASTVSKRLGNIKTFFYYAEKIGWLDRNPFRFLKSGDTTNPDKLEYVPKESILKVVEVAPLYWRVILLFGRFCGLRGSSELYRMEWGDIHFSATEEKGWVAVRAEKNKRHGRSYRVVPLPDVLERHLIRWAEQAPEGEKLLFPGMEKKQNFSTMTGKLAAKAGLPCWKNPWYNLRKSFCSDLLPVVKDITTYEQITDHSYTIAAKHYQIMTGGRLAAGMNQALEALENIPTITEQPKSLTENVGNSVQESVRDLSK